MNQHPHSNHLRRGRFSESGRAYLVTTVSYERSSLFVDFACCRAVVAEMRSSEDRGEVLTLAWVLMPDHLHWLFELESGTLSSVVGRFKQGAARRVNEIRGQTGERCWQEGFHDRAVRREEDIRDIARYVVANPLRAGLVGRLGDHSHWDAVWL